MCDFTLITNLGFENISEEYYFSLMLTKLGSAELIFQDNSYNLKRSASCSDKLEKPQDKQY